MCPCAPRCLRREPIKETNIQLMDVTSVRVCRFGSNGINVGELITVLAPPGGTVAASFYRAVLSFMRLSLRYSQRASEVHGLAPPARYPPLCARLQLSKSYKPTALLTGMGLTGMMDVAGISLRHFRLSL